MGYTITDVRATPSLREAIDALVVESFAEFMLWESPGNWRWSQIYKLFPERQVGVLDERGALVAAYNSVPVHWDGTVPGLPAGFDDAIVTAVENRPAAGTATCALNAAVGKQHRDCGLAELLLTDMRQRAAADGHRGVLLPVRPTWKSRYPLIPMDEYLAWRDADGAPFDPWLRTHRELGAELLAVAARSLVIHQPASRWKQVYGRPMPGPGAYLMPGGLVPVEVDADRMGTYAEPNVWMVHPC